MTLSTGSIESGPWEQNACFTIKGRDRQEVRAISDKLARYAERIGAGLMFSDYEGPQEDER